MQKTFHFIIFILTIFYCHAQNEIIPDKNKDSSIVCYWVEYEASFPGGQDSLKKFLRKSYNIPDSLENTGKKIYGTIVAAFIIKEDGTPSQFEIIKSLHPVLDNEWLRVLKLMPKWNPARQNGNSVKARYKQAVTIDIPD